MANRFELFRLSLLGRDQMDLFEFKGFSREDWLKKVFSVGIPFTNQGIEFYYSPALDYSDENIIVGRVGRHVQREENLPPEKGLEDFTHDTWLASVLVLDPTEHTDGQKLAIQNISQVGKPVSVIRGLISEINERYKGPFHIEASQIVEAESFWQYVEQNRGEITSVSFDFIAPNMLGADDEFTEEMRKFRDSEKARKVKLTIQSEDGINPETERVRRAVGYALLENKGKVTAKAKEGPAYNSSNTVKQSYIEDVKLKGVELVKVARQLANRILGRE